MALIDDVFDLCGKLAAHGWAALFEAHGLAIGQSDSTTLARELARELPSVRRAIKGFEDFAQEGHRGVEPGFPARSLLYHALASPNVLTGVDGRRLTYFPTPRELEAVEDYVFGAQPPTSAALLERVKTVAAAEGQPAAVVNGIKRLSVVVFAYEYRPASQTCQKVHADLVFARTGIARVGTVGPQYDAARRGFLPENDSDPFALHVLPARYAAFLAVRLPGNKNTFRPMRFREKADPETQADRASSDRDRWFWVPVHKLFSGPECLAGHDLRIAYTAEHVNEKIGRVRLAIGQDATIRGTAPYRFRDGIAELSHDPDHGAALVVPVVHPRLVEPAMDGDKPVTFHVPKNNNSTLSSSYSPPQPKSGHNVRPLAAPEFVHARTLMAKGGQQRDLNDEPNVAALVGKGGYDALCYVDFSGDGWVGVQCDGLNRAREVEAKAYPAYSLVTAPDFFPTCDQRELTEWTATTAFPQPPTNIWEVDPDTLCDQRFAANLQLPSSPFDPDESTVTAVVSLLGQASGARMEPPAADALRHSHLPDDAAGVFDPGWDVSRDVATVDHRKVAHLAAYGLGSPFPEDAKLCAALSTFWPGVAPDSTRAMEPGAGGDETRTVSPLTDEEIGQVGGLPWDGMPGPQLITVNGQEIAEFASFDHVDYVRNALDSRFTLWLTARVTPTEYENRVMAMALVNRTLGSSPEQWRVWHVISFQTVSTGAPELVKARTQTGVLMPGQVYRFILFRRARAVPSTFNFRKRWVAVQDKRYFFVDPKNRLVLSRWQDSPVWRQEQVTFA